MSFRDTSKFKAGFADDADDTDEHRSHYRGCLCGWPDLPGRCPGPDHCPMHGEHEVNT
jgi:hypothetical protein